MRRGSTVDAAGPVSLTMSLRLAGLQRPSDVAERLPKSLIHRNVPGEPVHAFLADLDRAWERSAAQRVVGRAPALPRRRAEVSEAGRCSTAPPAGGSAR